MDLYKVLGLEGGLDGGGYATSAEIRSAYRSRTLHCHPDKRLNDPAQAANEFRALQDAYQVLSDEQKRKSYDSDLYSSILKGPIQPPPAKKKKKSRVTGLEGVLKPVGGVKKFGTVKMSRCSSGGSSMKVSLEEMKKIKSKYGISGEACERTVCCSWNCSSGYDEGKLREALGLFGPIDKVFAPGKCKVGTGAVVFKYRASASGAVSGLSDDPELKLQMGG